MPSDFTQQLLAARGGDAAAYHALFPLVYDELRGVARSALRRRGPGETLHTTALVHETYMKLVDASRLDAKDRAHFFALAARVMRQILIDHFRRGRAGKRGADRRRVDLRSVEIPVEDRGFVLVAVDDALCRLARFSPRLEQVVEMRFFGGMTESEIAEHLGVTERTVRNDWAKAKAWLGRELDRD